MPQIINGIRITVAEGSRFTVLGKKIRETLFLGSSKNSAQSLRDFLLIESTTMGITFREIFVGPIRNCRLRIEDG